MQFPGPLSDFNVDISNLISKKGGFTLSRMNICLGSKTVLFSCLGQVDFPVMQVHVTFHSHMSNRKELRHIIFQLNLRFLKVK